MKATENNKLIAEFMGYSVVIESRKHTTKNTMVEECISYKNEDVIRSCSKEMYPDVIQNHWDFICGTVKYNSSWDWLMPVVRKVVELSCSEEGEQDIFLSDHYTSILETIPLAIIEDSYKVVVEFIKWYNENK